MDEGFVWTHIYDKFSAVYGIVFALVLDLSLQGRVPGHTLYSSCFVHLHSGLWHW